MRSDVIGSAAENRFQSSVVSVSADNDQVAARALGRDETGFSDGAHAFHNASFRHLHAMKGEILFDFGKVVFPGGVLANAQ